MAASTLQSLGSTIPWVVNMANFTFPRTVVLRSIAANRAIALSVDGGIEFFTPAYDVNSLTSIAVSILAPVTHVELTGAASDQWAVI